MKGRRIGKTLRSKPLGAGRRGSRGASHEKGSQGLLVQTSFFEIDGERRRLGTGAFEFDVPALVAGVVDRVHHVEHVVGHLAVGAVGSPRPEGLRHVRHADSSDIAYVPFRAA